jgi:glycine/D-amino acid oxidase-like deaminating enzyme
MQYDYLLVGHGLAGAILAYTLEKRGHKVLVIDAEKANSASNVAAGLINPVAGKRFAKTWQADVFIPFSANFYRNLEAELGQTFFHQKPILKLFSSVEEQNNWMGKSAGEHWNEYIEATYPELPFSETVHQELGGLKIGNGGFVEIRKLLQCLRKKRLEQNNLLNQTFDINKLTVTENGIVYDAKSARKLIFCEGWQAVNNPYFSWLPFSPNKGEVLDIAIENFTPECIYNKGVYVVPYGAEFWKVGATYNWRQPDEIPTEEGKEELISKTKQLLKLSFKVTGHLAGIRPATRDRKPLIGLHPELPALGIFNGMGSKGVSMAPFLAQQFAEILEGNGSLWAEVSVSRYQTLYYEREKLL